MTYDSPFGARGSDLASRDRQQCTRLGDGDFRRGAPCHAEALLNSGEKPRHVVARLAAAWLLEIGARNPSQESIDLAHPRALEWVAVAARRRLILANHSGAAVAEAAPLRSSIAENAPDVLRVEIRRALEVLFQPGDVIELRIPNAGHSGTISGYYDDWDALARDAARLDRRGFGGIYVTANPVLKDLMTRGANRTIERAKQTTTDADIRARRWLPIDFDPKRAPKLSSTDTEHDAALALARTAREWLCGHGIPRRSMVLADSGNGAHLLVRVDLPNNAAATDLCKRFLLALAFWLSTEMVLVDTGNFNAARIWKLYSTTARKGAATANRPHRRARLLEVLEPLAACPTDLVHHVAALAPVEPPRLEKPFSGAGRPLDVEAWLTRHGLRIRRRKAWHGGGIVYELTECPFAAAEHGVDGAAFVIQFSSGAVAARCHHDRCRSWGWPELRARYEREKPLLQLTAAPHAAGAADSTPTIASLFEAAGLSHLTEQPDPTEVEASLRKLTALLGGADRLRQTVVRTEVVRFLEARKIKSPAAIVDAALDSVSRRDPTSAQGKELVLDDPVPWPTPVNGADLLEEFAHAHTRYVVLSPAAADAAALWDLHTWLIDALEISPILAVTSPQKRCGKSTHLDVHRALVRRPLGASNISVAAVFRVVEESTPTLLIDEADTFLSLRDELQGVLNGGHLRSSAQVVRTVPVGDRHETRVFRTFCAKAIAAIGELRDTIADRAIPIRLQRRAPHESAERLRRNRVGAEMEPLRRQAARWAADNALAVRDAEPEIPSSLHDRAADNWHPLLAIADLAGADWPARARRAALALSGASADDDSDIGTQLLADVRQIFQEAAADKLASEYIVRQLAKIETRPWAEWKRGKAITSVQLARQLKRFGIRPKTIRTATATPKGYDRVDFTESWQRYLPREDSFQAATSPQPLQLNIEAVSQNAPPDDACCASDIPEDGFWDNACGDVADESDPEDGEIS